MDKKDWIYVLGIIVLVLSSILCYFDKITAENLLQLFMLVAGALITGTAMYALGKHQGFKEGSGSF